MKGTKRQQYFLLASGLYVLLGVVIIVRALVAGAPPAAVLGVIFIALGLVRLRDYKRWRSKTS